MHDHLQARGWSVGRLEGALKGMWVDGVLPPAEPERLCAEHGGWRGSEGCECRRGQQGGRRIVVGAKPQICRPRIVPEL